MEIRELKRRKYAEKNKRIKIQHRKLKFFNFLEKTNPNYKHKDGLTNKMKRRNHKLMKEKK